MISNTDGFSRYIPDSQVLQQAVAANGQGLPLETAGANGVELELVGPFGATVNFEVSDDKTTWYPVKGTNSDGSVSATTTTTTGLYFINTRGALYFQARVSGFTSGNVTAKGRRVLGAVQSDSSSSSGGGSATSAKQDTGNTSLASIDSKTPASPATSGKQDTGNTSLASIDSKIPSSPATAGNQTTGNTSLSSINTNAGSTSDAAVTSDANGTLSAKLRGLVVILADIWDSANHFFRMGAVLKENLDASIADTANLSSSIDKRGFRMGVIHVGAGMEGVQLGFLTCATSGGTYTTLKDESGNAVRVTGLTSSADDRVFPVELAGAAYFKIQTLDSAGAAQAQTGALTIKLTLSS